MITFNIYRDRFVCEKDANTVFEIYVDDGENKQMLQALVSALADLQNDELESVDAIEFQEAY